MSLALAPAMRRDLADRLRAGAAALLEAQHGRFAPWLAVALGLGVLAYFDRSTEPGLGALWVVPPLVVLAAWVGRRQPLTGWVLGMGAAGLLGFGAAAWHAARMPPLPDLPRSAVLLSGTVAAVEALPEGRRVTLEAPRLDDGAPLARTLRVRLRATDLVRLAPGDTLTVRALLREPADPAVPDGWDFRRAAFFSGLGGSGTALGPASVVPGAESVPGFARLRVLLEQRVQEAIGGPAGAVAAALLTGSQAAIPPAEIAAMRDSGLAHLLSVSGLHMAIVMGAVFATLRLLVALVPWLALRLPGKAIAACAALFAGVGYTLLTGSQVPMQRCLVMAAIVTLGLLSGRRALTVRTLAIAAAVVLLVAPAELLGPSFQMSFAAVLALAAGYEALRGRLSALHLGGGWRRRVALAVIGLMLTSVLAGLATAPFGLHHFGRLQVYGVLANAIAVPITSFVVMPAGMIALLLMPFGLEAPALWLMGLGVEGILETARLVAALPEAAPNLPPLPGGAVAVASFGFSWLALWRGRVRLVGVPVMLGALAAGMTAPPPDVLVSADARLVALRTQEGVFLHELPGASAFNRAALLRRMGVAQARPLPLGGTAAAGAIACAPAACTFRPRPDGPEAVLFRTAPPPRGTRRGEAPDVAVLRQSCGHAALLVASEPLRPRCFDSSVVDRFTVWRSGPQAAWLRREGAVVVSVAERRGERPWVPPPPMPARGTETLPLAPRDGG